MKNQLLTVNPVNPSAERKKIREERKKIREERKKIREERKKIREERKRIKEERNENKKSTPRSGNSSKCSDLKIISYWFFTQ